MIIAATSVSELPAFAGLPVINVPESATLALLATGLGAIAVVRRFRK